MANDKVNLNDLNLCLEEKQNKNGEIQAIFFDLDGTLIDTMDLHYRAYREVFRELGGEFNRSDFDFHSGPPATITIPLFANVCGLEIGCDAEMKKIHARKKVLFENLLSENILYLLPAAEILIRFSGKIPISVVTSGNAHGANAILRASGILQHVDVIISADDVTHGKPDPEPYLRALAQLNVDARRSIAFEDHNNGIQSATRARLDVVDVRTGNLISDQN